MTTATGDVVFDFKAISPSPQNPYTLPTGLTSIKGTYQSVGTSPAATALKMLFSGDGVAAFSINNPATSGVLISRVEQFASSSVSGDWANAAILDSSGNGYVASHDGDTIKIYRVDAFVVHTSGSLGASASPAPFVAGDVTGISLNLANGALVATVNGTTVATATDTTYTTGLAQSYLGIWTDGNAAGVQSFGASGIAGGGGPTENRGLRIKLKDRIGADPTNATGYTVIVRAAVNSTSILYSTTSAAIVDGIIEIDSDAVGAVGAVVYASIYKEGASIDLDKNASGRLTVVDLLGAGES